MSWVKVEEVEVTECPACQNQAIVGPSTSSDTPVVYCANPACDNKFYGLYLDVGGRRFESIVGKGGYELVEVEA